MEDLYIYKIVEEYFFNRKENIPKKVLSLLKNVEPYLKDISDFLEALHLQCEEVFSYAYTQQFEFRRTETNYEIKLALDCKGSAFYFSIRINNSNLFAYHTAYHTDFGVDLSNIKQEIENFKKWVEN